MSRPEVLLVALCERASMDSPGRPTLEGVFHRIGFHRFPALKPRIVIAVELWGTPYVSADIRLRITGPSFPQDVPIPSFDVAPGERGFVSFAAQFDQVPFTRPGVHALDVHVDGDLAARRRFLIEQFPHTVSAS